MAQNMSEVVMVNPGLEHTVEEEVAISLSASHATMDATPRTAQHEHQAPLPAHMHLTPSQGQHTVSHVSAEAARQQTALALSAPQGAEKSQHQHHLTVHVEGGAHNQDAASHRPTASQSQQTPVSMSVTHVKMNMTPQTARHAAHPHSGQTPALAENHQDPDEAAGGVQHSPTTAAMEVHLDVKQERAAAGDESTPRLRHPARPRFKVPPSSMKIYLQRYRRDWEELDECRGWLQEHQSSRFFAWCRACQKSLSARKKDLLFHATSKKHKNNMELLECGEIIDVPQTKPRAKKAGVKSAFSESLLTDPELADWLCAIPNNTSRGWCRYCATRLSPQVHFLRNHAKSRKHLANEVHSQPQPPPEHDHEGEDGRELVPIDASDERDGSPVGRAGVKRPRGRPPLRERSISPLLESDFAGRVTYSIGIGNRKVGFIGAGSIAQAIAQGMLEQGLLLPNDILASAPSQRNMPRWKRWKCNVTHNNDDVFQETDVIFLAVKTTQVNKVINKLTPISDGKTRLIISVVPGVTRERLIELLEKKIRAPGDALLGEATPKADPDLESHVHGLHVVRAAPNKMVSVSRGFCAYCMNPDLPHALYLVVETMFSAIGTCVHVEESLMDAYSTMVSSGAAFTCAFIEALVQGGVNQNIPWDDALKAAASVVAGTSQMLMRCGIEPSALRKTIATPGGSTIAALSALHRGGLDDAVVSAMEVGCDKTTEMASKV